MCKIVMITKAAGNATLCAIAVHEGEVKPTTSKSFTITGVKELSPTQPRPSEANVIPNCVAAR